MGRRFDLCAGAAVLPDDGPPTRSPITDVKQARLLALLGDSITTDHISPAGNIKKSAPAGEYLLEHQVRPDRVQLLRFAARQP